MYIYVTLSWDSITTCSLKMVSKLQNKLGKSGMRTRYIFFLQRCVAENVV